MNRIGKTIDLQMNTELNCAQAILTEYGSFCGIEPGTARMLGRTLGGGVAGQGRTCGYVTAGLLAVAASRDCADETEARKETHPAAMELMRRFMEAFGTTQCSELLDVDMSTAEGKKEAKVKGLIAERCPGYARCVAETLEDLVVE